MKFIVSRFNFSINDKSVNDAFKNYLRRSVLSRIKFFVCGLTIFAAIAGYNRGLDLLFSYNIVYLVTSLVAWYVTKRHLWTIDYHISVRLI